MVRDVAVDSSSIDGGNEDSSATNFPPAAVNGNGHHENGGGGSVRSEDDLFDENAETPTIKLTEIRDDLQHSMLFNEQKR